MEKHLFVEVVQCSHSLPFIRSDEVCVVQKIANCKVGGKLHNTKKTATAIAATTKSNETVYTLYDCQLARPILRIINECCQFIVCTFVVSTPPHHDFKRTASSHIHVLIMFPISVYS